MKNTLLFLPIFLAGCALSSALHKSDGNGGYIIEASGNNLDNKETLLVTINKRATKLCGSSNYEVRGNSPVERIVTIAPIKILTRNVVCNNL